MTGMSEEDLLRADISASDVGDRLTTSQEIAADLLRVLETADDVDAVLGLRKGTTARWATSEEFQTHIEDTREYAALYGEPKVDYSRALDQSKAEAARALALDGVSQVEAARKVGVSDRSIRNWMKEPIFQRYMDQLRSQQEREEAAERDGTKREIAAILSEGRVDAARRLVELAKGGDAKAIASLLKAVL